MANRRCCGNDGCGNDGEARLGSGEGALSRRDFSKLAGLAPLLLGLQPVRGRVAEHRDGSPAWPVLNRYDHSHLTQIALPLGGIGTGTISLGGRGDLRHWEIENHPAKGFEPQYSFFALRLRRGNEAPVVRVLEGQIAAPHEEERGFRLTDYGLPRFRECRFLAAYPFAQVLLTDPDVPAEVRLEAFNPLIPADPESSGLPLVALRYVIKNTGTVPLDATVCGSITNFIGHDSRGERLRPTNALRATDSDLGLTGILMFCEGLDPDDAGYGTFALSTPARGGISHRIVWPRGPDGLRSLWNDLEADGRIATPEGEGNPHASLAIAATLEPGETREFPFLLTWHFPNRHEWRSREKSGASVGNYYATKFSDAWAVAVETVGRLAELEEKTRLFVRSFCDSTLPDVVKEAALANLSTLRTETCFRTADGYFFGWEGCLDEVGCCPGSCTHVWNYDQATPFLFGSLAVLMREVELEHCVHDDGFMPFRVTLPLTAEQRGEMPVAAVDGQMGCIMKLHREWQLGGDEALLRRLWPHAKRALQFCWIEKGWDADRDGVMEGAQHTTTDGEYFGPNPIGQTWYFGALRAAEEMATFLGETEFAALCSDLFKRGSAWCEKNMFDGEYYAQQIRMPKSSSDFDPRLVSEAISTTKAPEHQIGDGCQSDQLVGQWMAHLLGLGYLLEPRNVKTALESVMKHNFRERMGDSVQYFRSFAVNEESALLFGTYPHTQPGVPNWRFSEVWTGIEHAVAAMMFQEGLTDLGMKIVTAVRDRFDGYKRNPWNETECGYHYARALASWSYVLALTGFGYSAVDGRLTFKATPERSSFFWSTGYAWGTAEQNPANRSTDFDLQVLHGQLAVRQIALTGAGSLSLPEERQLATGDRVRVSVPRR